MSSRNTIIISSLTLVIGIAIGRFSATPTGNATEPTNSPLTQSQALVTSAANNNAQTNVSADTAKNLAVAVKAAFTNNANHSSSASTVTAPSPQEPASNNRNNTYDGSPESAAKNYPNEISPEEIDRVLPAPFNDSFKHTHGFLREKYKDFVANTQPNDWDVRMQNKITDFIFSSPYAKFLNVESLLCKSGLCEIRLFETKQGAFNMILSEMALQDWWDIGGYHASGNGVSEGRTAYHVLLPRK